MFRVLRCFNISTSERPDDLLLVIFGVSSPKRDGEDKDDDGLDIDTTSPNCAEAEGELPRRIGVDSPNCASVVAVTFDRALVDDEDSSNAEPSESSCVDGSLENSLKDLRRVKQEESSEPMPLPIPFGIIRIVVRDTDGRYASASLLLMADPTTNRNSCPAENNGKVDDPRAGSIAHKVFLNGIFLKYSVVILLN